MFSHVSGSVLLLLCLDYSVLGLGGKVPFMTVTWFSKTWTNSKNDSVAENLKVLICMGLGRIYKQSMCLKSTWPIGLRLILSVWGPGFLSQLPCIQNSRSFLTQRFMLSSVVFFFYLWGLFSLQFITVSSLF